jgi:hypothetical protein
VTGTFPIRCDWYIPYMSLGKDSDDSLHTAHNGNGVIRITMKKRFLIAQIVCATS